jgi:lysophospholipase L1-like esterase
MQKIGKRKTASSPIKQQVRCVVFVFIVAALVFAGEDQSSRRADRWVGTWSASPQTGFLASDFNNHSLRMVVRLSVGGDRLRLRLSNAFGSQPLVITATHVGIRSAGAAIVVGSDRVVTFSGSSAVTIPPGALSVSDAVNLPVPALSDLAVSIFLSANAGPATTHNLRGISYVAAGDATASESPGPYAEVLPVWFFLTGVEVSASKQIVDQAVVAFGDSITDGDGSTPESNSRWPDVLARRLISHHLRISMLNEGIAGNCILHDFIGPNALARFDRDVLGQTEVRFVIVLEGINDIGTSSTLGDLTADEIIAGLQQLVRRAHARDLKIFGATLTPFEGTTIPGYFSLQGEMKREAINKFIRSSGTFDDVIDFDKVIRDPGHPTQLLPAYDSGDHLHPNDAGYEAMGSAIDLSIFTIDGEGDR